MNNRLKEVQIIDEVFTVKVAIKGGNILYFKQEIEHQGKLNHKLWGKFIVKSPSGKTIKFYLLTDSQFIKWTTEKSNLRTSMFTRLSKANIRDPDEYLYSSKDAIPEGNFEIDLRDGDGLYFVLDNYFSALTSKDIHVQMWEKWEEDEYTEFMKRKIVNAKEEIEKAEKNLVNKPEDVMTNLRTGLEMAIKEKFEFKKIKGMKYFLSDAKEFDLPLPSYTLIQSIYSEGNKRLHAGEINTRFEIEESLQMVKNFIDKLSDIQVSKIDVDNFKKKSKSVI